MSNYPESTNKLIALAQRGINEAVNTRGWIVNLNDRRSVDLANFSHTVTKPAIQAPPNFSDLFGVGDSTAPEIIRLNGEARAWMDEYFPAISGDLRTLPEDLLCGIISGVKPFGVDKTIFEIVWHQARDRAYRGQATETKSIASTFSAAGFTLSPGAMVAAITESEARASQAIAEVNREQAIKDADIKLDLLKFAEEQAIRLKLGVMQSMADFYRMWYAMPDRDMERARIRSQAMGTFYQALGSYYNIETAFARLGLESSKAKADVSIENSRMKLAASKGMEANVQALGPVASAFGQIASGAASAASTLVAQVESL